MNGVNIMEPEKILDVADLRKHMAFILNEKLNTYIQADNIRLDMEEMKPGAMPYIYEYRIGIELGSRLPIKPLMVTVDSSSVVISYVKKSTKDGYEFNDVMTLVSYVDAIKFSI